MGVLSTLILQIGYFHKTPHVKEYIYNIHFLAQEKTLLQKWFLTTLNLRQFFQNCHRPKPSGSFVNNWILLTTVFIKIVIEIKCSMMVFLKTVFEINRNQMLLFLCSLSLSHTHLEPISLVPSLFLPCVVVESLILHYCHHCSFLTSISLSLTVCQRH